MVKRRVRHRKLKEYIIQLDKWLPSGEQAFLDEISIDAYNRKEAVETAIKDVFMDVYPRQSYDYLKRMTRITQICDLKWDKKLKDWKTGRCRRV